MGDHARGALDMCYDAQERAFDYMRGRLSREDVEDIVDEQTGAVPDEIVQSLCGMENAIDARDWEVHYLRAANDLHEVLYAMDRPSIMRSYVEMPTRRYYWQGGGKLYTPQQMTTAHLRNAIAFAERHGMKDPIVDEMKQELGGRT